MKVREIKIPSGIRFISEISGYRIPDGQSIIDKVVCGCGFTEFCIRPENPFDTILCSPRVALLENKVEQHLNDQNILYLQREKLKEEFKLTRKGIKKPANDPNYEKEEINAWLNFVKSIVQDHYIKCKKMGLPVRYLCTYDSFYLFTKIFPPELFQQFHVVVDEFQSIFLDSFFKAGIELDFFKLLNDLPNVCYVSATPMLDKYLDRMAGFKDLSYYRFSWPKDAIQVATVYEKRVSDPEEEVVEIIRGYKLGQQGRPWKETERGIIFSNEVVFYVNSVRSIANIIRKAKLDPEEVNIICSTTNSNNQKVINKLSTPTKKFTIGKIPKKGEPHKMFTFCTSTVYLGADFYSDNAYTVIMSDANIQSLAVDVRLDLPQIIGRQRSDDNPWKHECVVFYKTFSGGKGDGTNIDKQDFQAYLEKKRKETLEFLNFYENAAGRDKLETVISKSEDRLYFISQNYEGRLVYNEFLEMSEERAWEVIQKDYSSRISVISSMSKTRNIQNKPFESDKDSDLKKIIDSIKEPNLFKEKFRRYCLLRDEVEASGDKQLKLKMLNYYKDSDYELFYSHFGTAGCRTVGFKLSELSKMLNDYRLSGNLSSELEKHLVLGGKYFLKDLKSLLRELYDKLGINATPKASRIVDFYEVKEINILDPVSNKLARGYQIISKI